MKKRVLSMLLVLVMMVTVFAGCGKKEDTSAADAYMEISSEELPF